jgi:phenylalanyl-tRNA synthetase alpha chain
MVAFLNELKNLEESFAKEFSQTKSLDDLEKIKVGYLGRKGRLTSLLRGLKDLSEEEKPAVGKRVNEIKEGIEKSLKERWGELKSKEKKIKEQGWDYTLPGRKVWTGKLHPLTQVMNEVIEIFYGMGFEVVKGPDVESEYYNFDALNFPKDHPARDMMDTFYIDENLLLRTHTSPVQVRIFEKRKPPVRILAPGRVYRNEAINARSYCVFHQVEGFYVDYDVTFADLKGVLTAFAQQLFGKDVKIRFRSSFFPFTEPSAEIDISCVICGGRGCSVCKFRGWLEILGAGMIDPEVFKGVGYDSEIYSGYAFGLGIDRIAMLKYRIDDIRLFYENDLRFLRQF